MKKHLDSAIHSIDVFQQKHRTPALIYAVIKKYGDDRAGYQAALLTYYGFLSLFPLLLVLTTVANIIAHSDASLQAKIIHSITDYFPGLGDQLAQHIQTLHENGVALIVGILLTIYGARGVADAFRNGVNDVWQIPRARREGFPKSLIKSLSLLAVGGSGLILAALLSSLVLGAGHGGLLSRALSLVVNLGILFLLFTALLNLSLPKHITIKETRGAAISAAVGLMLLQSIGGYLLTRELRHLDALYSYFAVALGLLFWIYLQAQVLYYSIEFASVTSLKLVPRSLGGHHLTNADKRVYAGLASKERMLPRSEEHIDTSFTE